MAAQCLNSFQAHPQYLLINQGNQPGCLGQWNKVQWRDHHAVFIKDTHQRLKANNLIAEHIHFGLQHDRQTAVQQCLLHFLQQ